MRLRVETAVERLRVSNAEALVEEGLLVCLLAPLHAPPVLLYLKVLCVNGEQQQNLTTVGKGIT